MDYEYNLAKLLHRLELIDELPSISDLNDDNRGVIRFLNDNDSISKDEAFKVLAEKFATNYWNLDDEDLRKKFNTKEILRTLDTNRFLKDKSVPLYDSETEIFVATCNPLNQEIAEWMRFELSKQVTVVLADEVKILKLLHRNAEQFDIEHLQASDNFDRSDSEKKARRDALGGEDTDASHIVTSNSPAIKLCDNILAGGVLNDASDIHVEPKQDRLQVRLRVDGTMQEFKTIDVKFKNQIISRVKLLSGMNIAEKRRPQDGKLRIGIADEKYDMRVSTVPTPFGEKIVLRILKSNFAFLNFPQLGFPEQMETQLKDILCSTGKMLLVTGPTGSGKTTSLYTCLKYCQEKATNIQTVEDPIEQTIPGINQIQINHDIGVTFVSALRSILRQDPDVIMLGEIRDNETAKIALQASDTGHLVLSTLHTNSAPSAITRLLNLGTNPSLLAANLAGILAQRLVRKICTECKKESSAETKEKHARALKYTGLDVGSLKLYEGVGCDDCNNSGFKGRTGIYSFLRINEQIASLIHAAAPLAEIISAARQYGFQELHEAAGSLLESGETTIEEVLPYIIQQSSEDAIQPAKTIAISTDQVKAIRERVAQAAPAGAVQAQEVPTQVIAKPRIVVIDDSPDARMLLSTMLRSNLFEVIEAKNGQDGLKKVYENNPDLILCDYEMPIMDGREFLLNLKNDPAIQNIPVVMLTAIDTEDNETNFIELGASDFISKNASYKLMLSRIRRLLKK